MLEVNSKAVPFELPNENDEIIRLSDFLGKKVVLYFYPKDNTAGCTKQACAFKEVYQQFVDDHIVVIGISKDSSRSHMRFKEKYELPFILLSDVEHQVIEAYDCWKEKKLYGKTYMGTTRSTYIIDEEGIIIKTFEKATPATNAMDILNFLHEAK